MEDWDNFYMLIGGTAGTLIGLIFVVITLGMEHSKAGDSVRTRFFVTPILVHFTSLLLISLAMVGPISPMAASAGTWGAWLRWARPCDQPRPDVAPAHRHGKSRAPVGRTVSDRGLRAGRDRGGGVVAPGVFAATVGAMASVLLLLTALRNSWAVTLAIAGRRM